MSATINTFPPFHSMNSPRGWILAVIVLLHASFIWLLSSGMGQRIVEVMRPPPTYVDIPTKKDNELPLPPPNGPVELTHSNDDIPMPPPNALDFGEDEEVTATVIRNPNHTGGIDESVRQDPLIVLPEIDTKAGLSEPLYPASEIRGNHSGTVLVSVLVLVNGSVGEVRLDQSSGRPKLDESAMREARKWRLKPGMRDGVPIEMWKQIPITFRLQEESRRSEIASGWLRTRSQPQMSLLVR